MKQNFLKSPSFKLLLFVLLAVGVALLVILVEQAGKVGVLRGLDGVAIQVGMEYRRWFQQQDVSNAGLLILFSFLGGLVASISPCILSLLPVNLSYIGTRDITSRHDALLKASAFVLGVVTVLSLFGLFSSLMGFVLVQFQGYFHFAVGLVIGLMGLSLLGILRLPLPQLIAPQSPIADRTPPQSSAARLLRSVVEPYGVGLTFALVSSPCTSPVMFAVLTAAAATGSQVQSVLAMVSYALGYTILIFFASLFTGLVKQTRSLLAYSNAITRVASVALLLVGGFYLVNGARWILAQ